MRVLLLSSMLFLPTALAAQQGESVPDIPDSSPGHGLLKLGVGHFGISLGNSARWSGLRINFRDRGVRQINGINLTLWKAARDANREADINGLALGLAGPEGGRLTGVSIGVGGVLAYRRMLGLNLGGLGLVSSGSVDGVNFGGLGIVADGPIRGINLAGLGAVADGGMTGLTLAGLGVVADGPMSGVTVAGLGVVASGAMNGLMFAGLGAVADGGMNGIAIAGLGTVTDHGLRGLGIGGLAVVTGGRIDGVGVGGLALVSDGGIQGAGVAGLALVADGDIMGLGVGGLAVVSDARIVGITASLGQIYGYRVEGLAATVYRIRTHHALGLMIAGWIKAEAAKGVSIAPYNQILGAQHGLAIGIFNSAGELHGIQIGLLNRARNNKPPFRWLPIFNAHLN